MVSYVVIFVIAAIVGFVAGALVYRNNSNKSEMVIKEAEIITEKVKNATEKESK